MVRIPTHYLFSVTAIPILSPTDFIYYWVKFFTESININTQNTQTKKAKKLFRPQKS